MSYADVFSAMSHPMRRAMLERLIREGPLNAGSLVTGLLVSRPAVSQHLKVLLASGLVSVRASGTRRVYNAELVAVTELREYLDRLIQRSLAPHDP